MDPENHVVKLCYQGMQMEAEYENSEARALFERAWHAAADDYEACIAAHYLARQQETDVEALQWNQESLKRAEAVKDDRVKTFYPSLYLNMGKSLEETGEFAESLKYYKLAAAVLATLPPGHYGDVVRDAVARALERIDQRRSQASPGLESLSLPKSY
jgi:tetratricopeptide (TPR) repeat protein